MEEFSMANNEKVIAGLQTIVTDLAQQAEEIPAAMQGCIPLETEELLTLKSLLCKAVARMHESGV